MTGFGKVTAELPSQKVTIEIKSVNSKQFDLSVRIPPQYREKELQMRNELIQSLERGKIELNITVECIGADTTSKINMPVVEGYAEQIRTISRTLDMALPSDWFQTLLRLPDVVRTDTTGVDESEWNVVYEALREAIRQLKEFRTQEGAMLKELFEKKISNIAGLLTQIDTYENERLDKIRTRILDNLRRVGDIEYDPSRFEQEMFFYIEKLDINEEKSRLDNHLKYFIQTLDEAQGQGKKLGFISQEIGREINTLGAKSNHIEIQKIVVQMKDELEQIKEQVLNIL
jgi:uncharacterized protein (TIGR00255 family)